MKRYPQILRPYKSFEEVLEDIREDLYIGVIDPDDNKYRVYIYKQNRQIESWSSIYKYNNPNAKTFVYRDDEEYIISIGEDDFTKLKVFKLDNEKKKDLNIIQQQRIQAKGIHRI